MTNALAAIDANELVHVCGGAADKSSSGGANEETAHANWGITIPTKQGPIELGLQGDYSKKRTDYAHCLDHAERRGYSLDQTKELCRDAPR